jgi:ATP-dependent RNA helicase RhlB
MKFQELNLHPEVLAGIEKAGFADCTDVQSKVCPISIQGRDVMARSKTGSGKTAVFVITILEKIARERAEGRHPKAMIVSPTRELALQIASDAEILSSGMSDVRVECFYGGVGYDKQKKALSEGVDIYVGTPGRLLDFMNSNGILFSTISMFVVDEADRMFDMGFYPDIQRMFAALPDKTKRQTMMFSATLSTKVRNLAWNYMNNPEEIELEPEEITVNAIVQELYHTTRHDKFKLLLHLLKKENPSSVLIFANTKYMTVDVSERLKLNGYNVACLMGDMPQEKRQKALERMRDNKIWGLVATDVAARGLQIDDLPLVINYDIPEDFESYVHRIGRTARAGKNGKAITLADEEYVWGLEAIENYIQMKIPVMWADSTDDVEDLSAGKKIYNKEHLAGVTSTYSHGKRPARPNGRGPVRSPKRANVSKVADKRRSSYVRKDAIDDAKLSRMSQDERLAYYRKEFFAEEKRDDDIRKPQPANKAPASKKPRPQSRPCSAASSQRDKVQVGNSKPAKVQPKPAQKGLKGLFNKLFGRK